MAITLDRSYEQIKEQVGPVLGDIPGAWWVGTDASLAIRDKLIKLRKEDGERRASLAMSVDSDPHKTWESSRQGRIVGFTPNDKDNVHAALRQDKDYPDMYVPNKRTKAGKLLAESLDEVNKHIVTMDSVEGVTGGISTYKDGQLYRIRPGFQLVEGYYPFVYISKNPDDSDSSPCPFYGELDLDPKLWERAPLSYFARILEDSEAERG